MGDDDYIQILKEYTRQHLWDIWQAGKIGDALSEEDARMYEVMEGHLQYGRLWDRLDVATDDDIMQNGVNVILHIVFHAIIENQLAINDPPAVGQVLSILKQKGLNEHEAVHAIAGAMAFEIHDMLSNNRMYDEARYVRELRKLPLERDRLLKNSSRRKK